MSTILVDIDIGADIGSRPENDSMKHRFLFAGLCSALIAQTAAGQPAPGGAAAPGAYPSPAGWAPPAPTLGEEARPFMLRLEMPYDPDKGIPPGYRLGERRRTNLVAAGAATLGGLWLVSALAGGFLEEASVHDGHHGWPLWIPVAGPFVAIDTLHADLGTPLLLFDGVLQGAALATLVAGIVIPQKVLKYQLSPGALLTLSPTATLSQEGGLAGLTGTF